jgi:NuA3 HAT complex component NTO1
MAVLLELRNDLERVRLLADLVMKREKKKLSAATAQHNYFEILLTPLTRVYRDIIGKMKRYVS